MDAMIPDGVLFLIAVSAIPQDTNLKYEVRAIVIYIYIVKKNTSSYSILRISVPRRVLAACLSLGVLLNLGN